MKNQEYLSINHSAILFDRFGHEVVAINNNNGHYYSLNGVSADIWALLEQGATLQTIVGQVQQHYEGDHAEIESSVTRFLSELHQQELIVVSAQSSAEVEATLQEPQKPTPYEEPRLEVYSDMQDLLLLDPIHEVDKTGWPNKSRQD